MRKREEFFPDQKIVWLVRFRINSVAPVSWKNKILFQNSDYPKVFYRVYLKYFKYFYRIFLVKKKYCHHLYEKVWTEFQDFHIFQSLFTVYIVEGLLFRRWYFCKYLVTWTTDKRACGRVMQVWIAIQAHLYNILGTFSWGNSAVLLNFVQMRGGR